MRVFIFKPGASQLFFFGINSLISTLIFKIIKIKNMESNLKLSLINGIYSPEEAKEILMNVFASKIQFHELKNLRSIVNNDAEDPSSVLRVRQLRQAIDEFNLLLKQAEENNLELSINSLIEISVRKSEKIELA
jgi:hypothetical protein